MALSHELISQFAKVVNNTNNKKTSSEATVYGTVMTDGNGNKYVKLDGSDQLTPLADENRPDVDSTTANTKEGDRVSVLIKNHTATVTGNVSSPAASNSDIETAVQKYDIVVAKKIQASEGYIKDLIADEATIGKLTAAGIRVTELIADAAEVEDLIAGKITVTDLIAKKIDADVVIADTAIMEKLQADNIDVLSLIADKAVIENLIATEADLDSVEAKNAYLKFANIDFSNIGEAAIEKLFSDSGIIKNLIMSNGSVTGELVGVTFKGDLVEAGTLKADRLVVKGTDGNYYALNTNFDGLESVSPVEEDSIHGSVLVKKSIVAEKIAVKDLVAFGATIGRFHIDADLDDETTAGSIYSDTKSSVDNTTRGIYMDTDGQFAVGDDNDFIKFYKDADGAYKLAISAETLRFSASQKTVEETIGENVDSLNDVIAKNVATLVESDNSILESLGALKSDTDTMKDDIASIRKDVDLKVTPDGVLIQIQNEMAKGVDKVTTKTGFTFDDDGLVIDKTDAPTNTKITENGMTVNNNETGDAVLTANKDGVKAEDLHATTYLIIGKNSRFEDYNGNRTGCYWIGGVG